MELEFTKFEDIYHIFLNSIQDPYLIKIFKENIAIAEDMLEVYLLKAISLFKVAKDKVQDLDRINKTFRTELDNEQIVILSDLMRQVWLERVIDDITQMNLKLNDTDFKTFSEEKNLREKVEYHNRLREICDHRMVQYSWSEAPFAKWADGNYGL